MAVPSLYVYNSTFVEDIPALREAAVASAGRFASYLPVGHNISHHIHQIKPRETNNSHVAILITLAAVVLYTFVIRSFNNKKGLPLPVKVSSNIPFIGHIIGNLRDPHGYPNLLSKAKSLINEPIFTYGIAGKTIHIVKSTDLAQLALRHKNLSFDPWVRSFCKVVLQCTPGTIDLLEARHPTAADEYNKKLYQSISQSLSNSASLQEMTVKALGCVSNELANISDDSQPHNFYDWIRGFLTDTLATALFGVDHPLRADPSLKDTFWEFEAGVAALLLAPLPQFTAPKAYAARPKLHKAFVDYFAAGKHVHSSPIVRERYAVDQSFGIPIEDTARLVGVALLNAAIGNMHSLFYWLVAYAYHDEEMLLELRRELEAIVEFNDEDGTATLDTTRLDQDCPFFKAVFTETLRMVSSGLIAREVLQDTVLTNSERREFTVHRGSMVQIPSILSHHSAEAWDEPAKFNPQRFLNPTLSDAEAKQRKQAFHPFGGGKHMCPGRYLAYSLQSSMIATMILGFDVTMADGSALRIPRSEGNSAGALLQPTKDEKAGYQIRITKRLGKWGSVTWQQKVGESRTFLKI